MKARRRWASMSLCWGENAKVYGKENFPYSEAAYYSSMLWHTQAEGEGDLDNCERPEKERGLKAGFLYQEDGGGSWCGCFSTGQLDRKLCPAVPGDKDVFLGKQHCPH